MPSPNHQSESNHLPIEAWLAQRLGRPVLLTFTQNRSTMMSWRTQAGVLKVRVHELFMRAPEEIWECIGHYLATGDAHAGKIIDRYIAANRPTVAIKPHALTVRGRVHNLEPLFDDLNEMYFHGGCTAAVTWGREPPRRRRRRRSIT